MYVESKLRNLLRTEIHNENKKENKIIWNFDDKEERQA